MAQAVAVLGIGSAKRPASVTRLLGRVRTTIQYRPMEQGTPTVPPAHPATKPLCQVMPSMRRTDVKTVANAGTNVRRSTNHQRKTYREK